MPRLRGLRPLRYLMLNSLPRADLVTLAASFGVNGSTVRDRGDIANALLALPDQAALARALGNTILRLLVDEVE